MKEDFYFTLDGDLAIDGTGDLADTSTLPNRSLKQEIVTIVKSLIGEWKWDRSIGLSIDHYFGKPLTTEVCEGVVAAIRNSFIDSKLLLPTQLDIAYIKGQFGIIIIRLTVTTAETEFFLTMLLDIMRREVTFNE